MAHQPFDITLAYFNRKAKETNKKFKIVRSMIDDGFICQYCGKKKYHLNINVNDVLAEPFFYEHMHDFGELQQMKRNRRFKRAHAKQH